MNICLSAFASFWALCFALVMTSQIPQTEKGVNRRKPPRPGASRPATASSTTTVAPMLEIREFDPPKPIEYKPWRVRFRLTNNGLGKRVLNGWVQAKAYDKVNTSGSTEVLSNQQTITDLQINQSVDRELKFSTTSEIRNGWVELTYYDITGAIRQPRVAMKAGKVTALSSAVSEFEVYRDRDHDGIEDTLEHKLLERCRPYYLFSNDGRDEEYAPTDALWYITKSELLTSGSESENPLLPIETLQNAEALLFDAGPHNSSNFQSNSVVTNYHVNPKEKVNGDNRSNPGRHGNDWTEVLAKRSVGLYGHVVPVRLTDPYGFTFEPVISKGDSKLYYKIEYWQFFGYNEAYQSEIGNHEGDWTSVQLIYDPEANIIRSVFHFAHGVLFRFDITAQNNTRNVFFQGPDGPIKEYRGAFNYTTDLDLSRLDLGTIPERIVRNDTQIVKAQNNLVRFFCDPQSGGCDSQTGEFTHPVVYIENGTHEFFPSEHWSYYGAPNHNGKSYHYLTATPPNLGEVDAPLDETPVAKVVLQFNGYWGAYGRFNDPPPGPALHKNWTMLFDSPSAKKRANLSLGF